MSVKVCEKSSDCVEKFCKVDVTSPVELFCSECGAAFEVSSSIASLMRWWEETVGAPLVCPSCALGGEV